MRSQIKLARVRGIEIGLHYSWLIIAILIAFSLAGYFRTINSGWSTAIVWTASLVTAALFFVCLVAHELAHALVARSYRIPVRQITLFALGGVTQTEEESPNAQIELWIGIAGPLTSFMLGLILLLAARGLGWVPGTHPGQPVAAVLVWLGYINLLLGGFNMIPGFPLDGGRVLRAILWRAWRNEERATRSASRIGQITGILMICYGIFRFFTGAGIGGLWLSFLGWFLLQAATSSYVQYRSRALLNGMRAADLMSHDCVSVDAEMRLQEFVDEQVLRGGHRCFLVMDHGRIAGLVTPRDLREIDRSRWPATEVREVMRPLERMHVIEPETPATKAMELMAREDLNQIPVVLNHHVEGIVSRSAILRALQVRAELEAGKA